MASRILAYFSGFVSKFSAVRDCYVNQQIQKVKRDLPQQDHLQTAKTTSEIKAKINIKLFKTKTTIFQGGHKVGEKNSRSFPGFTRAVNLLFHRLSQQKVNVIMTFIKGHNDPVYPVNSCFTQIFE